MKKGFFLTFLMFTAVAWQVCAVELTGLNFIQDGEISQLEITLDNAAEVGFNKFHVEENKQIIIDLKNVTASERILRSMDTSEFSGSAVFIRAYKKPNSKNDLRIAIQLRDNVRSIIKKTGKRIILSLENRFGVFSQLRLNEVSDDLKISKNQGAFKFHIPKSNSLEDILENLTHSGRKKYVGKKISFTVKNVPVEDILLMIADASGFNVIISDEIKKLKPLTLTLTNLPWDQILDTILDLNKLVAKKKGVILMVTTLEKATMEKEMEIATAQLAEKLEPLVTKIFPISYAELKSLSEIIVPYLTANRGMVSADVRTNALIIKDTAEVIERVRKIISALDTQTPQVLIESKIVEVNESYSKELGLETGFNAGFDPIGANNAGIAAIGSTDVTATEPSATFGPGFTFSSAPTADSRSLFGLSITRYSRLLGINFSLQLMETESKAKIIASPKVVTQNNKTALIKSTDTDSFVTITGTGDEQEKTYEEVSATLSLEVTPHVTNEGAIIMEVAITKEHFGDRLSSEAPPPKVSREVKTNVLVKNGSTIVIGGIYSYSSSESHSGIPWLKDIPILGWLFRTPYNPAKKKSELIIFMTPRIINQSEAGLVDYDLQKTI